MAQEEVQSIKIYEDNDRFFDVFWSHIDNSKDLICITTYDMDHKNISGITFQKLRNAAKRGVKVFLIIDDLNFYANKDHVRALEAEGGTVVRNNPMRQFYKHLLALKPNRFFTRNHQKVMLVDDNIFIGSLNIANMYSSVRYGDGSFRDLNMILKRHESKRVREFFRDILIRNSQFYPKKLNKDNINQIFDSMNEKFDRLYGDFYKEQADLQEDHITFLEETPPHYTEVSQSILDMIRNAKHSIRIIQPYVTNMEELEDLLVEAMQKRGVKVELITARIRDQPVYRTFLNSDLFQYLHKNGAEIYEEPYKFLHMKAIEVDGGRQLNIGSFNQDMTSFYCNNEANILLENKYAATKKATLAYTTFNQVFMGLKRECRRVNMEESYSPMGYIENQFWRLFLFGGEICTRRR